MLIASPTTPARGTRPRNRRAITLQIATELFYRRGYAQVSMADIAQAMNVGASALYRHFPSKSDLLMAAIRAGLKPYTAALASPEAAGSGTTDTTTTHPAEGAATYLDAALRRLVAAAIEHRQLGVLWQRDARNLADVDQRVLREELSTVTSNLARMICAARPDLDPSHCDALAWCTMGALVSLGFHALELPRPAFDDLLFTVTTAVAHSPMPAAGAESPARSVQNPATTSESRRDELISVATALFADRGFAATGIDEIGDAAGMAGPSVYSHFASKQAILAAAIERANRMLQGELATVLQSPDDPDIKLAHLVGSYVRLVNRDRFVVRTLISDMEQLTDTDREIARREQRRYIDVWVDLLQQFAASDPISARIRVQAVLLVVSDAVQTPHLRAQPDFEQTLGQVAKNVLGIRNHLLS